MKILFASTFKLLAIALYLYATKTNMGINLVQDCHAWEILIGECHSLSL
ncbi:MAG: hypothetical protein Kow0049_10170 [Stanieria sp.]